MFGNNKNQVSAEQLAEQLEPIEERIFKLEQRVNSLTKENERLRQTVSELERFKDEIDIMMHQSSASPLPAPSSATTTQPSHPVRPSEAESEGAHPVGTGSRPQAAPAPKAATLYLAAPTPDGLFTSVSPREEMGKSLYRLTTGDGSHGQFSIIDSADAIALAVISVSQFIKPACKIDGRTQQRPLHIHTLEPGTAQKEDDGWHVVKKAVVRFD